MTKEREFVFFYILPLVAVLIAILIHAGYVTTILLFWGVPALLLSIWSHGNVRKAALFSLVATIFFFGLDIIFHQTGQWYVNQSSYRVFGSVPIEDLIFWFLFFYYPILFWEHFYEKKLHERPWSKKMTHLTGIVVLTFLLIASAYIWIPRLLNIPYLYLILDVLAIIPLAMELLFFPKLRLKFVRIGLFFAYVAILYEVTALYLGQWHYPSKQFLGWVEIMNLRFPFEEFVGWILLGVVIVLTFYEHYDDDDK